MFGQRERPGPTKLVAFRGLSHDDIGTELGKQFGPGIGPNGRLSQALGHFEAMGGAGAFVPRSDDAKVAASHDLTVGHAKDVAVDIGVRLSHLGRYRTKLGTKV